MLQIEEKFNLTKQLFVGNNIPFGQSALIWNNNEFTRDELFENIIKTADYLLKSGLKQDERIILLLNDTPAIYEFFLGAIAIGAIPVLINPKTKLEDLSYILNDSEATSVVSEIRPLKEIEEIFNCSLFLKSRNNIIIQDKYVSNQEIIRKNKEYFYPRFSKTVFIEEEDLEMTFVVKSKDEPAFWQYTSGTTGKPKAVVHSQMSMLSNTINFAQETLKITSKDRVYSIPKMFFGYGLGNSLFFPIWTGATVIIDDHWPSMDRITNIIEKYKPTVFFAVPKIYGALLKYEKEVNYGGVRIFYSAGSNLNATVNNKWKEATGKYVTQGIGCTEIGHVYISTIPTKENINATGVPVQGFNVKLVKEEGEEHGELYIQPSYKLLGYHGVKNQNKFIEDNWYKTSDNFSQDKEGDFIFSSRVDDMFKINGRMVVPSVIENYVLENYAVNEAVFVAIEDKKMSDVSSYLCITLLDNTTNASVLKGDLERKLSEKFPSYMCPKQVVVFDGFQYNSNGKIIKKNIIEQLKEPVLL
ncbi:AMP-binding protein [Pseudofulvibacter geojedonensis]|uniref:AMP-binding protein n=1 Tax=Pseudofulvibacter geojedonensis TaxID=1123758 RepID=A0ABW3I014_9FLAO